MNNTNRLISTALIGLSVAALSLPLGRVAEAKTLDYKTEARSETELVANRFKKFKKFKKGHNHKKFVKFKKFYK